VRREYNNLTNQLKITNYTGDMMGVFNSYIIMFFNIRQSKWTQVCEKDVYVFFLVYKAKIYGFSFIYDTYMTYFKKIIMFK
jgi:hypothetical protein